MEERKTLFDYLAQIMTIFGVTIIILNILCKLFGEDAASYSSIFQLGDRGIAVSTMLQFLAVSVLITGIRYVFFTDRFIKKMSVALRTVGMLLIVVCVIFLFTYLFAWFPLDMWQAWVGFFVSFFVCFVFSTLFCVLKEKAENRALDEALKKMQVQYDDGKAQE